jgi:hypothetical protein
MPKLIKPDSDLTLCPLCASTLVLQPPEAQSPTRCPSCEYTEPAGSAHVVTFLHRFMGQYCQGIGLEKAQIDERDVPLGFCFKGNVFLAYFVTRGNELAHNILPNRVFSNQSTSPLFTTVPDNNGLFNTRVTTTHANVSSLGQSLVWFVQSVHDTLDISKSLNPAHNQRVLSLAFHPSHDRTLLNQMPGSAISDFIPPKPQQRASHNRGIKHG